MALGGFRSAASPRADWPKPVVMIYYNRVADGSHYAAWKQPTLFAQEVRAAFRTLRKSS